MGVGGGGVASDVPGCGCGGKHRFLDFSAARDLLPGRDLLPVDAITLGPPELARRGFLNFVTPGTVKNPKSTQKLMEYWAHGKGAAKIKWGAPCDFCRCLTHLGKYVHRPDYLKGLCANLHHRALGVWPGHEHRGRDKGHGCPC